MHNHGPVLTGLCLMDRELAGAVVAELFAYTFTVHEGETVAENSVLIPVAHDSVALSVFPETFTRKSTTHTVREKAAAFRNLPIFPVFLIKQQTARFKIADSRRVLTDILFKIHTLCQVATVKHTTDFPYIRCLGAELGHIPFAGAINHTRHAQVTFTNKSSLFIEPTPHGISLAILIPVFLFHTGSVSSKVRHRSDKRTVLAGRSLA